MEKMACYFSDCFYELISVLFRHDNIYYSFIHFLWMNVHYLNEHYVALYAHIEH